MNKLRTPVRASMPVLIPINHEELHGDLQVPENAIGLVIFIHGSGSSRLSPRNRWTASYLNEQGLATLLLDLLTEDEQKIDEKTMELRFNIPLLSNRSILVAKWALQQPALGKLPIGLFGASTGAAAALTTAAMLRDKIVAVVSRGGRPDMAENALTRVQAPSLLLVGGNDVTVLGLNRQAYRQMHCTRRLHVVPGATHLFEEKGALEEVAQTAAVWFREHMLATTAAKTLAAQSV